VRVKMRRIIFQTEGRVQCPSIRCTFHFPEFIYYGKKQRENSYAFMLSTSPCYLGVVVDTQTHGVRGSDSKLSVPSQACVII
jgi:hypothetical protein